jgi:predicted lipoprotein
MSIQYGNFKIVALIASVSLLISCGKKDSDDNDQALEDTEANRAIVAKITDSVIVAGYTSLNTKVAELVTSLATLKGDKTQANLEKAQSAWKAAREPWEAGEGHIFGPVDTLGVDPATDSWPVIKSDLDGSLGGWSKGDSVEGYEDEVKGFHAIEYLLFGAGESTNTREVSTLSETQLEYTHSLAVSMKVQTQKLLDAWNNEYTATFKSFTPAEAAEELLGGLIGIVDEVGNGKIGDPFNEKNTTLVESQFSWNSTTDFANNLVSVKNVWDAGMLDLIAQLDETKASAITTQIDTAIAEIKSISDSDGDGEIDLNTKETAFRNQILTDDGRALIQGAIDALGALQASLESLQGSL